MHRIARDDMARHVEFFQQFLHGRDFVGFFVDVDMRQYQRRVDGERAEHLFCLGVVEAIETTFERLAIKRDNSRAGTRRVNVQVGRVFAKGYLPPSAPAQYAGWPYARAAFSSLS